MKNNILPGLFLLLTSYSIIIGCTKNYTKYYADAETPGLAIFSNTNNNILTCFVDGRPWRTDSRVTSGFNPRTRYEIYISKYSTNSLQDTLLFNWYGYFEGNQFGGGSIGLALAVSKNFSIKDLNALQGQRLIIDTTINGFYSTNTGSLNNTGAKGNGSIYFNTAKFDSIAPNFYQGSLSGLFEANFGSFKITKGRFDHFLEPNQIQFY
jgi:hypothetical protein